MRDISENVLSNLFVKRPNFIPFHTNDRSGGTLSDNELLETGDSHAMTQDTANCRETSIVPGR